MHTYYSNRAKEYEAVYDRDDSVRQAEQFMLQQKLKELFYEKEVLEVACGTGYWTQYVAEVAESSIAVDYSEGVLDVAKAKELPKERVFFVKETHLSWEDSRKHFKEHMQTFGSHTLQKKKSLVF